MMTDGRLSHSGLAVALPARSPRSRFATDSPLEGGGFEPSVPLYGELGALGRVRRDPRRHREARNARSFASTRSATDLRHAWGRTKPGSRHGRGTVPERTFTLLQRFHWVLLAL